MRNSTKQPDISLYDKHGYDYSTYWENRQYEHESETIALNSILKNAGGSWFADIGGSFGRHIPIYKDRFDNCILLDYSINSLKKAESYIKENNISNIHLVAGNVYNLPFKAGVIDGSMMIRVMHHLEDPDTSINEIARITRPGGTFILEFPNKNHLKSVIRSVLSLKFSSLFSVEPRSVPFENPEGTTKKEPGIMLNFHPKYIVKLLNKQGFIVDRSISASYLRIPAIKKIVSISTLLRIETFLQNTMSWTKLTPSIIVQTHKKSGQKAAQKNESLASVLACPRCKKSLHIDGSTAVCNTCGKMYTKTGEIWDLRFPLLS